MIVVTTDTIAGQEIVEVFGLVRGTAVRTRHLFQDIGAAMKVLVGGEPKFT